MVFHNFKTLYVPRKALSSLTSKLSHIICVREREQERKCERKRVFEAHPNLLKFTRVSIESVSAVRGLRAKAQCILRDYMTKLVTRWKAIYKELPESILVFNKTSCS